MLKSFRQAPKPQAESSTPGPWYSSLTDEEKVSFVSGYLVAMRLVTNTLTTLLSPLEHGDMDAEEFRLVLPDLVRATLKLWDLTEIGLPELATYAKVIYSEPEHAQVSFSDVFEVARDLYLDRITEEDARRKLAHLSR